jgi:hypothetical protein
LRPGERTVLFQLKIPESLFARITVRAAEMGMGRSKWLRLVVENALCKVPREQPAAGLWLGERLTEDAPPLIRDTNRAMTGVRRFPGPPRCLP